MAAGCHHGRLVIITSGKVPTSPFFGNTDSDRHRIMSCVLRGTDHVVSKLENSGSHLDAHA
jgi:hypothetical protein